MGNKQMIKGNYKLRGELREVKKYKKPDWDDFEAEALKKLGGSIAFVSKSPPLLDEEDFNEL